MDTQVLRLERIAGEVVSVSRLVGDRFEHVRDWKLPSGFKPMSVAVAPHDTVLLCGYVSSTIEVGPFENSGGPMTEALAGITLPDIPIGTYTATRDVISSAVVSLDVTTGATSDRRGLGEFDSAVALALVAAQSDERQLILHGALGEADTVSLLSDSTQIGSMAGLLTHPWVISGLGGRVGARRG
jgi:hypothetical protein